MRLAPIDVIAIIVVVAGFVCLTLRVDSVVSAILLAVVGYYFGRRSGLIIKEK